MGETSPALLLREEAQRLREVMEVTEDTSPVGQPLQDETWRQLEVRTEHSRRMADAWITLSEVEQSLSN